MLLSRKNKKSESPHFQIRPQIIDLLVRRMIVEKEFTPGPSVSLSDYVEVKVYETSSLNTKPLIHVSFYEKACTKGAFMGLWVICDELEARQVDGSPLHFVKVRDGKIRFSENPTLKLPFGREAIQGGAIV